MLLLVIIIMKSYNVIKNLTHHSNLPSIIIDMKILKALVTQVDNSVTWRLNIFKKINSDFSCTALL